MGKRNEHTIKQSSGIECVEVRVSKKLTDNCHSVLWPLSVYSLENHPVKSHQLHHDTEVFHFMLYDWKRTIQRVLEDGQISYSIIRRFTSEAVYGDHITEGIEQPELHAPHQENHDLSALIEMEEAE